MSVESALRHDTMANWDDTPKSADIRFRPGQGGEMSPEWAAYMLNLWWAARDSKMTFATAVAKAAGHFMVGEQP